MRQETTLLGSTDYSVPISEPLRASSPTFMPSRNGGLASAWQKVFPNPLKVSPEHNRVARLTEKHVKDSASLRHELDNLDLGSLSPEEQELWYRVRGTLEYREGNRSAALGFFERGLASFPASPVLTFSCAQEYEHLGQVERAKSLFDQIDLKQLGSSFSLEVARYLYLWDFIDEADKAIQWIFDAYYELDVADDNFLYIRNLPFYSTTFGYRATFAVLRGHPDLARRELDKSARDLHDYDFERLREVLEATVSGDWSRVLARLAESMQKSSSATGDGYISMRCAALKALAAQRLEDAYTVLDSVSLGTRNFRWLEDIRSIAKARAAHQFGKPDEEQRWLSTFLEKQDRLFEPNNAFEFGLTGYQEVLKRSYRARRANAAAR